MVPTQLQPPEQAEQDKEPWWLCTPKAGSIGKLASSRSYAWWSEQSKPFRCDEQWFNKVLGDDASNKSKCQDFGPRVTLWTHVLVEPLEVYSTPSSCSCTFLHISLRVTFDRWWGCKTAQIVYIFAGKSLPLRGLRQVNTGQLCQIWVFSVFYSPQTIVWAT